MSAIGLDKPVMTSSLVSPMLPSKKNVFQLKFPRYSLGEEIANSITHGIGACLSVAALVLLIVKAATSAPTGRVGGYVVGYAIFGASLVFLYAISTLYHAFPPSRTKSVFGRLDHSAIFFLIAGTYTAYCLGPIYGAAGWWTFGTIWSLATIGIVAYCAYEKRARAFALALYLTMGWFAVFVCRQIFASIPPISWILLLVGGGSYTLGVVFFMMKKQRWTHSVWHLFVLGGSVTHFFSLYWAI
ncbi:MAG: hemolysin III family protein [Thermoguttaceae bacterium]|nr:hemolysin III family protein [Thermoguttaceae bacterium]